MANSKKVQFIRNMNSNQAEKTFLSSWELENLKEGTHTECIPMEDRTEKK